MRCGQRCEWTGCGRSTEGASTRSCSCRRTSNSPGRHPPLLRLRDWTPYHHCSIGALGHAPAVPVHRRVQRERARSRSEPGSRSPDRSGTPRDHPSSLPRPRATCVPTADCQRFVDAVDASLEILSDMPEPGLRYETEDLRLAGRSRIAVGSPSSESEPRRFRSFTGCRESSWVPASASGPSMIPAPEGSTHAARTSSGCIPERVCSSGNGINKRQAVVN